MLGRGVRASRLFSVGKSPHLADFVVKVGCNRRMSFGHFTEGDGL
jgi:hypothetical protein